MKMAKLLPGSYAGIICDGRAEEALDWLGQPRPQFDNPFADNENLLGG